MSRIILCGSLANRLYQDTAQGLEIIDTLNRLAKVLEVGVIEVSDSFRDWNRKGPGTTIQNLHDFRAYVARTGKLPEEA